VSRVECFDAPGHPCAALGRQRYFLIVGVILDLEVPYILVYSMSLSGFVNHREK
jgi:hypothetical protein